MMQITRREEYGLKGLLFLAQQPDEKVFLVSEISRVQKILKDSLQKYFNGFRRRGFCVQ